MKMIGDSIVNWDKAIQMKKGYIELDKVKPGDSGFMTYYPITEQEYLNWKNTTNETIHNTTKKKI